MERRRTLSLALIAASFFLIPFQTFYAHRSWAATNGVAFRPLAPAQAPGHLGARSNQAINLNLGSNRANIAAPQFSGVSYLTAGTSHKVTPFSLLTSAELLAVQQVVNTGSQSILLGALGNAVGGSFVLSPNINQLVHNLVIPHGVEAIYNFTNTQHLNLSGTLNNSGTLFAVSSNSALSSVSINAGSIFNQAGGLLTTSLPAGGIPGLSNLNPNLSLVLNASHNIVNKGSIVSAANLSAIAGDSITNALSGPGLGTLPLMQAAGNLSLYAGSGSIKNAGLVSTTTGSINISAGRNNDIRIDNTGGVLQALAGSINVRDGSYTGKANLSISGGDLLAKEINLDSGCGSVNYWPVRSKEM